MFDKQKQQYDMLKKVKAMQKELKETEIEAKSSDGKVSVVFNAEMHLVGLMIDDSLMSDKFELEKKLKNTISEGLQRAQAVAADKTKEIMKDMNLNLPGM